MSKLSKVEGADVSWDDAYVVDYKTPDRIAGKIFSVIEAMGLKDTQEEASKDIIRTIIWEIFNDSVYISSDIHSEIREKVAEDSRGYYRSRTEKF